MAETETRASNLTLAIRERQLVKLIRELIADYDRTFGGIPTEQWLFRQLGER